MWLYSKLCILLLLVLVHPPPSSKAMEMAHTKMSIAARLKVDGTEESTHCWESMFLLQSCTGEVITFFMSGETYLSPGCCHAIRTIQSQCWPNLLTSLGYTDEEGDILEGYCEAAAAHSPSTLEPNNFMSVAP